MTGTLKLIGLALLVLGAIVGGFFLATAPEDDDGALARIPGWARVNPVAPGQPISEEIQQLRLAEERENYLDAEAKPAEAAHIPDLRELTPYPEPKLTPDPRWQRAAPFRDRDRDAGPSEAEQARRQHQVKALRWIDERLNRFPGHYTLRFDPAPADAPVATAAALPVAAPSLAGVADDAVLNTIHYARLTLTINSDVPGPLVARIAQGPLTGARLSGRVRREHEFMVGRFDRLQFQGRSYPVDAYAVDLDNGSVALQTRVDRRTVARWSAVLLSAVLGGWREAVLGETPRTYVSPLTVVRDRREFDDDVAAIVAGEIDDRTRPAAGRFFDRPPTVTVDEAIGVLFLRIGDARG